MIIKEINNKIKVLKNINKLSNTLSMISFSKLIKISKNIMNIELLYNEFINVSKLIKNIGLINCCIIITTNKGLCGNINNDILKKSLIFIKKNKNLDVILIGKKGIEFFKKKNFIIKKQIIFSDKISFNKINFSIELINILKSYKNIFIISSFILNNNIKVILTKLFNEYKYKYINKHNFDYNNLISSYLNYSLKFFYFRNIVCEYKSRMITMKSASDNSKNIIKELDLVKNKIRQFKVTQEMLEIINGSNL